ASREIDHSLGAENLQAEARATSGLLGAHGRKISGRLSRHAVAGRDGVAREQPDFLVALPHFRLRHRLAVLKHARETRFRLAAQEANQVHDVRAEHHEILAPSPRVRLSAAAPLKNLAESALG